MKVFCLVIALFAASVAKAEQPIDPAFDRLSTVGVFAFGGVGFAGVTLQGEKDFRSILSRPSALSFFEKLWLAGNPQAKAYALVGIRRLDLKRFNELLASIPDTKGLVKVETMRGCVISHDPFEAISKASLRATIAGESSTSTEPQCVVLDL